MARLVKSLKSRKSKPRTEDKTTRIRALLRDGLKWKAKGEYERAARCFDQVFRIEPENPDALYAKCGLYSETMQYNKALHLLERCRRSKSKNPQLNYIIGYHYQQMKRFEKAVVALEAAIAANPNFSSARLLLAKVYFTAGHWDKARSIVETVSDARPTNDSEALAHAGLAMDLGMFDRGVKLLRNLEESRENAVDVLRERFRLPEQYSERNVGPAISRMLGGQDVSETEKINLSFLAGKVADREARFDEAYESFKTGNDLAADRFDLQAMDETLAFLKEAFPEGCDFRSYGGLASDVIPVFVVGMPRAGKTTLETELKRHPEIADSQERDLRMYIDEDIFVRVDGVTPAALKPRIRNLSTQRRKDYANTYMDQVLPSLLLEKKPKYVLNTLPLNFQNVGLLKLVFPNARFVHMQRDPIDTCWFCYSKEFKNDYYFTNKLDVLGAYYRRYQALTRHWKTVLADDWIDVDYEDLVAEPKAVVARVLDYLGALDNHWDGFSSDVGHGLTTGYIGYWKNYETHLQPLLKSLDD